MPWVTLGPANRSVTMTTIDSSEGIVGFRYRKQMSFGKYFRVNSTKNGFGISLGPRSGLGRINISPTGRTSVSASVPGTGISASQQIGRAVPPSGSRSRRRAAPVDADADRRSLEANWPKYDQDHLVALRHSWRTERAELVAALAGKTGDRAVAEAFLESKLGGELPGAPIAALLPLDQQLAALEASWSEPLTPEVAAELPHLWATDPDAVVEAIGSSEELVGCDPGVIRSFLIGKLGPAAS